MPQPLFRTLTGKTLLRLAVGGATVLLSTTLTGTWVLYRQAQQQATAQLEARVTERARLSERVLQHTVETHDVVRAAFVDRWAFYQDAPTRQRFEDLLSAYPDGSLRSRREVSDGHVHSTGWVSKHAVISDDLKSRMVLFHDLAQRYGPGAATRQDNLFFVSLPEQANMGYDPYQAPDWVYAIGDDFNQLDYEWGRTAYLPAKPGDGTRWSLPELAEGNEPPVPSFTVITPIHVGTRHLAAVGTTIWLRDFLQRVLPSGDSMGRYLFFSEGGRLIADTARASVTEPSARGESLRETDEFEAALRTIGTEYAKGVTVPKLSSVETQVAQVGYSTKSDLYYAVARIDGPGWFVATTVPGKVVRGAATLPALSALGVGLFLLIALLFVFSRVLKRQVAAPLGELTAAATRLAGGDTEVRLPATRDDELGSLAKAFNEMAFKVAERDAALRRDKEEIETALTSLRLTEERWRAMTDNASDFIAVVDEKGCFTYVSPPVQRMLGYDAQELVGTSAFDGIHPEDVPELRTRLRAPTGVATQFRARHMDGSWRVLEVVGKDLRDHPGVKGLVLNTRDISEIVKAEEEMERQRESLHQSEKLSALGGLLAGVAHELNNPLAVVVGRAIQLQNSAASEADRETASKIRQAADRCARIVKTFLAMARRQEAVRAPTDLHCVIEDALDLLAYTLESSGVAVERRFADGLPAVMADADQINQVFMNLFANAQQAMSRVPGPRTLTIETGVADMAMAVTDAPADAAMRCVRVVVADTGPGVPAEIGSRIFDPFFTTKGVGEGTGVGLSVSLGIVHSHGGSLTLSSVRASVGAGAGMKAGEAGGAQGAQFTLMLPALDVPASEAATVDAKLRTEGGGWRVLVVDDEPEIAEIVCEVLEPLGHEVVIANGGHDALRRLAEQPFDAVFTDLKMPGMDGPALYGEIQRLYPALARRVIAVSGDTLGASARDFIERTGVPVIDKPFEPDEIAERLEKVMKAG